MGAGRLLAALLLMPLAQSALAMSGYTIPGSDDIEPVRPEFEMLFSPPKEWGFECTPDTPLDERRRAVAAADDALTATSATDITLAALLEMGRAWRCLAWAELDAEEPPELPANATSEQKLDRMDKMTREPLEHYEKAKARSCFWLTQPMLLRAVASPELERILCISVLWECHSNPTKMAQTVSRLAEFFPNSACRWPAEITLADAWFAHAMLEPAMKAFARVEAGGDRPDWKAYAKYKQAWANFNLGEFQRALEGLAHAITEMAACRSDSPKETEHVRRVTMAMCDDLPVMYAAVGQAGKARAFVERLAGERTGRILMALAIRYKELGDCDASRAVIDSVLPLLPDAMDRLEMTTLSAECVAASADAAPRLAALERVAEELAACLAAPEVLQEGSASAMMREYRLKDAEESLYRACATAVREGRKGKAPTGFEAAASFCGPYLSLFPAQAHAAEIHAALGTLASDLALFPQALDHLERCIALDQPKWTVSCRAERRVVCEDPRLPADLHGRCDVQ